MDLLIGIAIPFAVALAVWLPIAISVWYERRKFAEKLDESKYELRQPKYMLGVGIYSAILFVAPVIIVPATGGNETFTPAVALGFIAFALFGAFLAIYAIQWRIIVQNHHLIVRMPFKSICEIKIEDITRVKEKYNGIIAYIGKKRVFAVDRHVFGFEELYMLLYKADKMESTQKKKAFIVKQRKANIVIGVVGLLFFGVCLILVVFSPDETVSSIVYIGFSGFTILCAYLVIDALRWRLTVTGDTISVRRVVGKEKSYSIKSITRVNIKKMNIVICIDKKRIAKVAVGCSHFPILSARLNAEEIPLFHKGKLIER